MFKRRKSAYAATTPRGLYAKTCH